MIFHTRVDSVAPNFKPSLRPSFHKHRPLRPSILRRTKLLVERVSQLVLPPKTNEQKRKKKKEREVLFLTYPTSTSIIRNTLVHGLRTRPSACTLVRTLRFCRIRPTDTARAATGGFETLAMLRRIGCVIVHGIDIFDVIVLE